MTKDYARYIIGVKHEDNKAVAELQLKEGRAHEEVAREYYLRMDEVLKVMDKLVNFTFEEYNAISCAILKEKENIRNDSTCGA